METQPNGDKTILVNIVGLKIIIKPHIFLMVYYYFINAFPVYDIKSKDKPNLFTSDPEESPLMEFIIKIDDSLLCFQNKPGFKTIACEGKIFYKFRCETAKTKK